MRISVLTSVFRLRKSLVPTSLAAAVLFAASPATAAPILFSGALAPEVVGAPGTGWADIWFDPVAHTMRVEATFSGLSGNTTVSHIHCCTTDPGVGNAGVAAASAQVRAVEAASLAALEARAVAGAAAGDALPAEVGGHDRRMQVRQAALELLEHVRERRRAGEERRVLVRHRRRPIEHEQKIDRVWLVDRERPALLAAAHEVAGGARLVVAARQHRGEREEREGDQSHATSQRSST